MAGVGRRETSAKRETMTANQNRDYVVRHALRYVLSCSWHSFVWPCHFLKLHPSTATKLCNRLYMDATTQGIYEVAGT